MKKTAFLIMIATTISKTVGFFREIAFSYYYGASGIMDAYLVATSIPNGISGFIDVALSTAYIPVYNGIQKKKNVTEAELFTNNLVNVIIVICTIAVILVLLFTKEVVIVFAKGFTGKTLEIAVNYTKISAFSLFAIVLCALYSSYLRIKDSYIVSVISGLSLNFVIIFFIIMSSKLNSDLLIMGSVLGLFLQLLLLLLFSYKKGYRYKPYIRFKDKNVNSLLLMSLPIMFGGSVNQLNLLVDRTIASLVAEGGISALNYANRLNDFVLGLFIYTITTVLFPQISKMATNNKYDGMKKAIYEAVILVFLAVLPSSLAFMMYSKEVVSFFFGRGAFDKNVVHMTSPALFYYSIGMFAVGMRAVLTRAFYAVKDTITPVINASIAVVINIVLNFILSRYMGIGGLALATSIANIICMVLMMFSFGKKFGWLRFSKIFKEIFKILIASIVAVMLSRLSYDMVFLAKFGANISFMLAVVVTMALYGISVVLFKVEEIYDIINAVRKKII